MFKSKHVLSKEDDGSGSGVGGGVIPDVPSSPSADLEGINAKIEAQAAEIERLRKHSQTVLDEKKQLKAKFKEFDGFDPNQLQSMFDALQSSEEAKLIAAGKFDEVINRRTEKVTVNFEQRLADLTNNIEELSKDKDKYKSSYEKNILETALRDECIKAGVQPAAYEDAIHRASGVFNVTDTGEVEARDSDGNLKKVGHKPLTPALFIEGLREKAPHYWPASSGAGANGSPGKGVTEKNPFVKGSKHFNLTEQAKIRRENPELASRLSNQAENLS